FSSFLLLHSIKPVLSWAASVSIKLSASSNETRSDSTSRRVSASFAQTSSRKRRRSPAATFIASPKIRFAFSQSLVFISSVHDAAKPLPYSNGWQRSCVKLLTLPPFPPNSIRRNSAIRQPAPAVRQSFPICPKLRPAPSNQCFVPDRQSIRLFPKSV